MIKARLQDRARIVAKLGTPTMEKLMPDGVELRLYYGRRPKGAPAPDPVDINATESALALAAAYDIDLSGVAGSGKGGRILKSDVEALGAEVL